MFTQRERIPFTSVDLNKADKSITKLLQPSLLAQFQTEKRSYFVGADKRECITFHDDIYMLFNQMRLVGSGVGADTIKAWLDTLTPKSDALSQLRKKCSDDDLMSVIKSRYIQSPSELLAWSEYLNDNANEEIARAKGVYAEYVEAQKQAAQQASEKQESAASSEQVSE